MIECYGPLTTLFRVDTSFYSENDDVFYTAVLYIRCATPPIL